MSMSLDTDRSGTVPKRAGTTVTHTSTVLGDMVDPNAPI